MMNNPMNTPMNAPTVAPPRSPEWVKTLQRVLIIVPIIVALLVIIQGIALIRFVSAADAIQQSVSGGASGQTSPFSGKWDAVLSSKGLTTPAAGTMTCTTHANKTIDCVFVAGLGGFFFSGTVSGTSVTMTGFVGNALGGGAQGNDTLKGTISSDNTTIKGTFSGASSGSWYAVKTGA